MNFLKIFIAAGALFLVLASGAWYFYQTRPEAVINSFEKCAAAGNPVMESYPRQCRAPDGKIFAEYIGNELELQDFIRVHKPRPNALIKSPVIMEGEARGSWFDEGLMPVRFADEAGDTIVSATARAEGDWRKDDFVPFRLEVKYILSDSEPSRGLIILDKYNPEHKPASREALLIPVIFEKSLPAE